MIAMLIGSDSVSDVVLKGCPIEPVMSNPDKSERPETGYIGLYGAMPVLRGRPLCVQSVK